MAAIPRTPGSGRRGPRHGVDALRRAAEIQVADDFRVVLVNPYELGRQPFALAEPAAWLARAGFTVRCIDLALEKLAPATLADARVVALYVGMHTATRIAIEALPRIRQLAPNAHICVYGLYAPMNGARLRELGVGTVLGGEVEPALLALCEALRTEGKAPSPPLPMVSLERITFTLPDRSGLPPLSRYAHLLTADGGTRAVGFAEGSRGCKHLCRHCPVVPVYEGVFRVVPVEVVMADIEQQVAAGATHISFGDPDFFNGPTHGMRLARALHAAHPAVTFDATIKVQHLIANAALLPELRACGCLFITSAVEAVDDEILRFLDKNHTRADFATAVALTRNAGIALAPTFVAFLPWTTLEGYLDLLAEIVALDLVESVPPVQLTIRLLVPEGSWLLRLPGFPARLKPFDATLLGYPWLHADARVDRLQHDLQARVMQSEEEKLPRHEIFAAVWQMAHAAAGRPAPALRAVQGAPVPRLSEPWYCCAEPTAQQLQAF